MSAPVSNPEYITHGYIRFLFTQANGCVLFPAARAARDDKRFLWLGRQLPNLQDLALKEWCLVPHGQAKEGCIIPNILQTRLLSPATSETA